MRHTKPEDLIPIMYVIEKIRKFDCLKEKSPGSFYYRSKNVIHFHVDKESYFCDIGNSRYELNEKTLPIIIKIVSDEIEALGNKARSNGE